MNNPFDKITETFTEEQRIKRIDEKTDKIFTPKPFRLRMQFLEITSIFFSYVFQALSATTEWLAAYILLSLTVTPVAAVVWATLIFFFIETFKRIAFTELIKTFSRWAVAILVCASAASIFLSVFGAYQAPAYLSSPPAINPDLINIDSVKQDYNAQIAAIAKEYKEYYKANERDGGTRLSSLAIKGANDIKAAKSSVIEAKQAAIHYAIEANATAKEQAKLDEKKAKKQYDKDIKKEGAAWCIVALINEMLYFLTLMILAWYYRRADAEKKAHKRKETPTTETSKAVKSRKEPSKTPTTELTPAVARQIGYKRKENRDCLVCGVDISHKRKDAKVCSASCRTQKYINNKS